MRFPGHCIEFQNGTLTLSRHTFDETELDPATDWKTALHNQEGDFPLGFVDPLQLVQALCRLTIGDRVEDLVGALDRELVAGRTISITDMPSLAATILHFLQAPARESAKSIPENPTEFFEEIPL